jgi:hypothetical protein
MYLPLAQMSTKTIPSRWGIRTKHFLSRKSKTPSRGELLLLMAHNAHKHTSHACTRALVLDKTSCPFLSLSVTCPAVVERVEREERVLFLTCRRQRCSARATFLMQAIRDLRLDLSQVFQQRF